MIRGSWKIQLIEFETMLDTIITEEHANNCRSICSLSDNNYMDNETGNIIHFVVNKWNALAPSLKKRKYCRGYKFTPFILDPCETFINTTQYDDIDDISS